MTSPDSTTEFSVKVVSVTQPIDKSLDHEQIIAYCARVSNPNNQNNTETMPKLLKYLQDHKHWSPFEMAHAVLEIETSRGISPQILRHRSFSFQEFCITGDSLISTVMPSGVVNKIAIEKLYKNQKLAGYKNISLRVLDENTKSFTKAKLKEVFKTGIKPVYRITTSDGKQICSTKEHKFLTREGFLPLGEIIGLDCKNNTMSKIGIIGVNGVPLYKDKEWLKSKRDEMLTEKEIAELAGCSAATIHKWIRVHSLTLSPEEAKARAVANMNRLHGGVWNKDKFGYSTSLVVSDEHKEKIRNARSGSKSNWWKGGVDRSWRQQVWDFTSKHKKELLIKADYTCSMCRFRGGKLEIHHIVPVSVDKEKAFDLNNLAVVCEECHDKTHNQQKHAKIWREKHKGNTLTTKWVTIEGIEFLGDKETFDLEVDHKSHNYVANGIVVHNSQRYQSVDDSGVVIYAARRQDKKNKQNSIDDLPDDVRREWQDRQLQNWKTSFEHYTWALDNGIAKECARFVLPLGSKTRLYMSGTIRSWMHFLETRTHESTQKEHRDIALACREALREHFPSIF